ncbi:MAG: DHHA1 domain-containing protein [Phascolarctobacterium sp.]|uniref:alanyl-tRNA editing protein n=1 Tax=Phascolarctobacterium sp. TaxID=2049039 RepID=UPI0026DAD54E|nr:DHHA1 domain-containing protein [Phascolarctobacterium sp.]MDO4920334.1 DHHA1 domain-containing protein [Phascolarctobacterium sp.]
MTVKLFENNSLLRSCEAVVTACAEKNGLYLVELDQTVFFPEGGGQLSDRGKLGGVDVVHVSEKDGHIYHECTEPLSVGAKVQAVLDWPVRLDRMQQHLGEHILSYACWKLFEANNIGFHMNEDMVTIDLDKELTEEELLKAELYTNEIIWDNRPVSVDYMDSSEAVKLKDKMRKFNSKLTGILRIVSVQDADICTCCGTHPPFTGMLGSVKVIRHEKHKGGCRVEFLCGKRALLDADKKNSVLLQVAAGLSTKPELVPEHLAKLKADWQAELDAAKSKLLAAAEKELHNAYEAAPQRADGLKVVAMPLEGCDAKDIKYLLPKAAALVDSVTILAAAKPERISYAVVLGNAAQGDCRGVIKLLNDAFGGRGGGKSDCAQGGSDYCEDWLEKLHTVARQAAAV